MTYRREKWWGGGGGGCTLIKNLKVCLGEYASERHTATKGNEYNAEGFLNWFSWRTDQLLKLFKRKKKEGALKRFKEGRRWNRISQLCVRGQLFQSQFVEHSTDERRHKVRKLSGFSISMTAFTFYTQTNGIPFLSVLHDVCQQTNISVVLSQSIYEATTMTEHWMFKEGKHKLKNTVSTPPL